MALFANRANKATARGRGAGDATPLVCIDYEYLAGKLGPDRPVICLMSMSLPPHIRSDVEAAARHFLEELGGILTHESAYYLSGYCYGSLIALEMARLLIAEGKRIGSLVLIEPPYPGGRWPHHLRLMREVLSCYFGDDDFVMAYPRGILNRCLSAIHRRLGSWLHLSRERPLEATGQEASDGKEGWIYRAAGAYAYPPYPGRFTLLLGNRSMRRFFPTAGWRHVAAGGIDVH